MTASGPEKLLRVALILPGGVGEPGTSSYIPSIYDFVELLSNQVEVHVYSLAPSHDIPGNLTCGNARITYLPAVANAGIIGKLFQMTTSVRKDHRHASFELVHGLWAIPAGVAAVWMSRRLRIPAIVTYLGGETASLPHIPYGNLTRPSTRAVTGWVTRHANSLIALSRHQQEEIKKKLYPRPEIEVTPFGVNTKLFRPSLRDLTERPLRLLQVGNIHAIKDHRTTLRLVARLKETIDVRLRIVGPDMYGGRVQNLAQEMGLSDMVEFTGAVAHHHLADEYRSAHFLIHPSLHEAQGMVVAEAAATGLMTAGTAVGLLSDLGEDYAILGRVGDVDTLTKGILDHLNAPDRYPSIQTKLTEWASQHDAEWTVAQYLRIYDRLVTDNATARA